MPELPEVETIKRGLASQLIGLTIDSIIIRKEQLRWPIPADLNNKLCQQTVIQLMRRGKYLLFQLTNGTLVIHLGMSGSLHLQSTQHAPRDHDHVDFLFTTGLCLRYHDPRRFGAILWSEAQKEHPLLQSMGVEPLDEHFTGNYLKTLALKRHAPIKSLLMNSKVIAGIGNIYAAEALFLASIHPLKPASQLSMKQYDVLVAAIKTVLQRAIAAGGTTLKDYVNSEGKPGYFSLQLEVYGRGNQPCKRCQQPLQTLQLAQRSTVYCAHCQLN
jgi:formamidopyrimidine-DNA glycosylase